MILVRLLITQYVLTNTKECTYKYNNIYLFTLTFNDLISVSSLHILYGLPEFNYSGIILVQVHLKGHIFNPPMSYTINSSEFSNIPVSYAVTEFN